MINKIINMMKVKLYWNIGEGSFIVYTIILAMRSLTSSLARYINTICLCNTPLHFYGHKIDFLVN